MKKSSWIVLIVCGVLTCLLVFLYVQSSRPAPEMSPARMAVMLDSMKQAVVRKNVSALMSYVDQSGDTRITSLNPDQLRILLNRAFRQSENLVPTYDNLSVHQDGSEEIAEFDLSMNQQMQDAIAHDYNKLHIKLHLHLVEVPHLLGLYHTKEWKISRAESNLDLANYGDY
jgi:hypothetical protein